MKGGGLGSLGGIVGEATNGVGFGALPDTLSFERYLR